MIIIRITMEALPEKQKEVVQTILSLMASMKREAGCLSYALLGEMKDKNLLCVIEEWESREKLDNYLRSDFFGVLLGTKSLLRQAQSIQIHTVRKTEGMEAVIAAREIKNENSRKGARL
ncbi:MAG: antibiotic biosynthesis monooxygenase family protein [Desulfobacterales bacterium]